jgi:Sec-independent protein translocase protein TatA
MSGIGSSEILLILLAAAIVIGPQNAQPLFKALIKGIRIFKRYVEEMKSELDLSEDIESVAQEVNDAATEISLKDETEDVLSAASALKRDILPDGQSKKHPV